MPKSEQAIAAELEAAGCKAIRESHVDELSRLLLDDEHITDSIVWATSGHSPSLIKHLVGTSHRVAMLTEFMQTTWLGSLTGESRVAAEYILWSNIGKIVVDEPSSEIVGYTPNLGELHLYLGNVLTMEFQGVAPSAPAEILHVLRMMRLRLDRIERGQKSVTSPGQSLLEQLEQLAKLRTSGALDEDEFRAAKRKLLLD